MGERVSVRVLILGLILRCVSIRPEPEIPKAAATTTSVAEESGVTRDRGLGG